MKHLNYSQRQAIESRRQRLLQENMQMCQALTALRVSNSGPVSAHEADLHTRYRHSNMQLFPHQFAEDDLKAAGMSRDSYLNI